MPELEESDVMRFFRALSLGITLSFPHLTGIDVKPVMRTTQSQLWEGLLLAQFGNWTSLMRMRALGAVLGMLLSQEHSQPDAADLCWQGVDLFREQICFSC